VETLAVCPGAGGSLLRNARADLLLTGEMRHHDVLAANARGSTVVLTDHTNCERGYLPVLRDKLLEQLPDLGVVVSELDADPLRVV
jgi:putative NIF3 family GTP cyclohydrolase 1 type 2